MANETTFDILNFPLLDVCYVTWDIHIPQLIHFARASIHISDVNSRDKLLNANILKKDIGIKVIYVVECLFNFIVKTDLTSKQRWHENMFQQGLSESKLI